MLKKEHRSLSFCRIRGYNEDNASNLFTKMR